MACTIPTTLIGMARHTGVLMDTTGLGAIWLYVQQGITRRSDMSRQKDLMVEVIKALDEMRDPFDHSFLVEHQVTADECFMIAGALSNAYKFVMVLAGEPPPERE